jgi:hypothetical protein
LTHRVLLGAIAVAAVIQQIQVSWLARTVTNDDATLLWYSAQEWASRQVRQPGFYGQSYGSTLEGLPLDALARLGLDFWIGLPVVMGLFAIAGWSLLDPRQALVEFQAAADDSQADESTLTGRAVLVGDTWVVTRDTFCRDTFVSRLGQC